MYLQVMWSKHTRTHTSFEILISPEIHCRVFHIDIRGLRLGHVSAKPRGGMTWAKTQWHVVCKLDCSLGDRCASQ